MIDDTIDHLQRNYSWAEGNSSYKIYCGTPELKGNLTIVLTIDGGPSVVLRTARWDDAQIVDEYDSLRFVNSTASEQEFLKRTVESPIDLLSINGRRVLVKEYIEGRPAKKAIGRGKEVEVRNFLQTSVKWLTEILKSARSNHVRKEENKRRMIKDGTDEWDDFFSEVVDSEAYFLAPTHYDFSPDNLLVSETGELVGVIDFETFSKHGIPVIDLMNLIITTGTTIFGHTEEMIRKTFFECNFFSRTVKNCVAEWCDTGGISERELIDVLPLYCRHVRGHSWMDEKHNRFYELLYDELAQKDGMVWR